jgi:hypothetical protein
MTRDGKLPRCDVCGAVLEEVFSLMDHLHREPPKAPLPTAVVLAQQMRAWVGEYLEVSRRNQRSKGRRHRRHR